MGDAGHVLDVRNHVRDGVACSNVERRDPCEVQCGSQPLEPVRLVGPDAGLEPAGLLLVVRVDRCPVEPPTPHDLRHGARNRHVASGATREDHRRRIADRADLAVGVLRLVPVAVAGQEEVEPGAGADVEMGHRADLGGDESERWEQQCAPPDLVGLCAARPQQVLERAPVGPTERPEGRAVDLLDPGPA